MKGEDITPASQTVVLDDQLHEKDEKDRDVVVTPAELDFGHPVDVSEEAQIKQ